MCVSTMAQVEINETNFPDKNFRDFVSQNTIDTNGDGVLSQAELNAVTGEFYPIYQGIEDMTGIQYFTSLTEIACWGNNISGANMYKFVNCLPTVSNGVLVIAQDDTDPDNVITKAQVKIAKDKGWEIFKFSGGLQSYAGEDLSVSATFFPDATFRSVVVDYDTDHNSILSEDELEKVLTINVKNKGIKNLKGIEHFPNLVGLLCSGNNLTTLDVSNNKKLMILDCSNNSKMTSLTVSKDCEVLNEVAVFGTNIKGAEMTKVVENLPETTVGHFLLSSGFNNLITIDARVEADRKGWKVLFYDGENFKYAGYGITERNFPDEKFRAFVAQYDTDNDNFLYSTELDLVTAMDVSKQGIKDLTGIECFSSMWFLDCSENNLSSLDVSANTKLTHLVCCENNLSSLDVSANTKLTTLDCSWNRNLSSLNVSQNTALMGLWCAYCSIASIDVSKMTALEQLDVQHNNLTSLDVSNNKVLTFLDCKDNGLNSLKLTPTIKDLRVSGNDLSTLDVSKLTELESLTCSYNNLTSLDVSNNTKLEHLDCGENSLESLDVSKNTALTYLSCFYNRLESLDVSKNTALTDLDCHGNSLESLDVSKNTALTLLDCSQNSLESLDVTKNTALTWLYCLENSLESLDVSKNTALTELLCYGNQIKGLNMDNLVNSLPNTQGTLGVCNDSSYPDNVITNAQVKVATDKGWKVRRSTVKVINENYKLVTVDYAGLGDVTIDNKIDQDDLDLLVKIVMGQQPVYVFASAGDLNQDGKTDAQDVVILVNILKSLGK